MENPKKKLESGDKNWQVKCSTCGQLPRKPNSNSDFKHI